MKAYPVIFTDREFLGQKIPKEFVEFAHGILKPSDVDAKSLDDMICSFPKENFVTIKNYMISITSGKYSDDEISNIFQISGAPIVYLEPSQREIAKQILEVIEARMDGRELNLPLPGH